MFFDLSDKSKGWMGNHTRWCALNPKSNEYRENLTQARSKKVNFNNQYTYGATCSPETKIKIGIKSKARKHTEESKEKLRTKALSSNHRRLKKNTVIYNDVILDSSWELELAKRLDLLNIKWIRPVPIKWVDLKGTVRNYFPDFYLPDYDIYLDPKNPFAYKVQMEKIIKLQEQYNNIIFLTCVEQCKYFSLDSLQILLQGRISPVF